MFFNIVGMLALGIVAVHLVDEVAAIQLESKRLQLWRLRCCQAGGKSQVGAALSGTSRDRHPGGWFCDLRMATRMYWVVAGIRAEHGSRPRALRCFGGRMFAWLG